MRVDKILRCRSTGLVDKPFWRTKIKEEISQLVSSPDLEPSQMTGFARKSSTMEAEGSASNELPPGKQTHFFGYVLLVSAETAHRSHTRFFADLQRYLPPPHFTFTFTGVTRKSIQVRKHISFVHTQRLVTHSLRGYLRVSWDQDQRHAGRQLRVKRLVRLGRYSLREL